MRVFRVSRPAQASARRRRPKKERAVPIEAVARRLSLRWDSEVRARATGPRGHGATGPGPGPRGSLSRGAKQLHFWSSRFRPGTFRVSASSWKKVMHSELLQFQPRQKACQDARLGDHSRIPRCRRLRPTGPGCSGDLG